jgi:uncharacterized protein YkwD
MEKKTEYILWGVLIVVIIVCLVVSVISALKSSDEDSDNSTTQVQPEQPMSEELPPRPKAFEPVIQHPGQIQTTPVDPIPTPVDPVPIAPVDPVPPELISEPSIDYNVQNNKTSSMINGRAYFHKPRTIPMPDYEFNISDKQRFLNSHNYFRGRNCANPVVWDNKLESLAQGWVNELAGTDYRTKGRGIISHPIGNTERIQYMSTDGRSVNVGQNIAYGGKGLEGGSVNYRTEIEDVVADWYEESELPNFQGGGMASDGRTITFTPSITDKKAFAKNSVKQHLSRNNLLNKCSDDIHYKYDESHTCSPSTGHFTQVVWKDTNKIGCAIAPTKWENGSQIVVCNYGPPGNILSEQRYKQNVLDPESCGNK